MIIEADKEGVEVVKQLCDIALKQGGIQNLKGVTEVLAALKEIGDQ